MIDPKLHDEAVNEVVKLRAYVKRQDEYVAEMEAKLKELYRYIRLSHACIEEHVGEIVYPLEYDRAQWEGNYS